MNREGKISCWAQTIAPESPISRTEERRKREAPRDRATNFVYSLARKSFPHATTETLKSLRDFVTTESSPNANSPAYKKRYEEAFRIAQGLTASIKSEPGEEVEFISQFGPDAYNRVISALAERLMKLPSITPNMNSNLLRVAAHAWEGILPQNHSGPKRGR